jgi:hypothetical protein
MSSHPGTRSQNTWCAHQCLQTYKSSYRRQCTCVTVCEAIVQFSCTKCQTVLIQSQVNDKTIPCNGNRATRNRWSANTSLPCVGGKVVCKNINWHVAWVGRPAANDVHVFFIRNRLYGRKQLISIFGQGNPTQQKPQLPCLVPNGCRVKPVR